MAGQAAVTHGTTCLSTLIGFSMCATYIRVVQVTSLAAGLSMSKTLQPISGVTVEALNTSHEDETNSKGIYALPKISPQGTYTIRASKIGYSFDDQEVSTSISGRPLGNLWGIDFQGDPDCFPTLHEDYEEWISVGKPDCWCYLRQCHGDADDRYQGKQHYWVSIYDLDVLVAAWNKPFEEIEGETITVGGKEVELICADFDHLPQGKNEYRVSNNDLDILVANWSIPDGPEPDCFDDYLEGQQAGSPVKHHTLEEIVIWLEELWLSDKEVRQAIGNRRWKEFLESLIEEWLSE
jgi:hypothetical protein